MRKSRIFRLIVRIFVLFLTTSVSLVSFLGGISAVRILENPKNIGIPDGLIGLYFNVTDIENSFIRVPFNVTNAGYFDLINFYVNFEIIMIYNSTSEASNIYNKTVDFPDIPKSQTYRGIFETNSSDFVNVPESERIESSIPLLFKANVTLGASYSLGLISISVKIYNFDLGSS